jgi:hypothetical protein
MADSTKEAFEKTLLPNVDHLTYKHVKMHGTITATVARAYLTGKKEQPLRIDFEPNPLCVDLDNKPLHYLPCKGMRIVMAEAWGTELSAFTGKSMELFGNPDVMYGGKKVGGIQISKLSHISKPLAVELTVSRGKKKPFPVSPLPTEPTKSEPAKEPAKFDPLPPFRSWLESKGLSEADAQERIGGRTLEEATDEDWKTLRQWAKELKPKETT